MDVVDAALAGRPDPRGRPPGHAPIVDRLAGDPDGTVVALEGERIVGYCTPRFDDLTVHPAFRRRGHGRRLIAAALELVRVARARRPGAVRLDGDGCRGRLHRGCRRDLPLLGLDVRARAGSRRPRAVLPRRRRRPDVPGSGRPGRLHRAGPGVVRRPPDADRILRGGRRPRPPPAGVRPGMDPARRAGRRPGLARGLGEGSTLRRRRRRARRARSTSSGSSRPGADAASDGNCCAGGLPGSEPSAPGRSS